MQRGGAVAVGLVALTHLQAGPGPMTQQQLQTCNTKWNLEKGWWVNPEWHDSASSFCQIIPNFHSYTYPTCFKRANCRLRSTPSSLFLVTSCWQHLQQQSSNWPRARVTTVPIEETASVLNWTPPKLMVLKPNIHSCALTRPAALAITRSTNSSSILYSGMQLRTTKSWSNGLYSGSGRPIPWHSIRKTLDGNRSTD